MASNKSDSKTFFIVPGFKMKAGDPSYSWLVKYSEEKKMSVIKVPVKWDNTVVSENAKDFIDFYNKNKSEVNYILGFSYGSVITLLDANILKPNKIFLCSLSPDFVEDRHMMEEGVIKFIGKKRYTDTLTRSGKELAKNLQVPSVVFYGEAEGREYPQLKLRAEETVRLAKNSKLVIVKDAPHQIDFPSYVEAIKREIDKI